MRVVFDHSEEVADGISTFWFLPERELHFVPGQFIELRLPHENMDDRGERRWFTISSAPHENPLIAITSKFAPDGSSYKNALRTLRPGSAGIISSPMGDFVLPIDKNRKLLFIASGIGITPVRSIISSLAMSAETRDIMVMYAARNPHELIFRETFTDYGVNPHLFVTRPDDSWDGLVGRIDAQRAIELIPDIQERTIFMSGPEILVEALHKDFLDHGIPEYQLVGDYFLNYPE